MRAPACMFAITLCTAAPLALAQDQNRGDGTVMAAGASDTLREAAADDPTPREKRRSAFGHAIAELAQALREENVRKAQAAQVPMPRPQVQTRTATDAPLGDDGAKVPQVAVQSDREL